MRSKLILFTTLFFSFLTVYSQSDNGEKVYTKLIKVNNKIYMLQGKGGNIGLSFGSDGVFMIDDQFAESIEQIQKDIQTISKKPVQFLVNTHFHGDHTGGNAILAQTGTIIFSQENVRTRLMGMIAEEKKKIPQEILPIVTFSEDLTFHYNGEKIYVFHIHDAHTDGDAMVYFTSSNVLHTGDVFFNGKYPFIDTENGGSLTGCIKGLEKAMMVINEDTKIIPGHGDVGSYKDLQKTVEMLSTVYKRVTMNYINKKSEEEVAKMTDLTKEYDDNGYGGGFISTEAFLRMVYSEVAKERGDIESNAEKNRKAREKVEKMQEQANQNKKKNKE
ncbi:MBL fold metallo-hydrolase [Aequorivita sp. CIP111184]|uniref:MBL fold metallo-hydrolase n=1 Tax=Aequorivita sp. CIP111184 TaxID=2211356 RepID=UPI000DBC3DE6|nr:MBL fold metallo-hydrolase [Aequorivita sp. CIP111184]SRX53024.1 Metallo-beta-lactamase type 2 [Aequorivita sp. CIP111184]